MEIERLKTSLKDTLKPEFYRHYVEDEIARMQRYTDELAESEAKKKLTRAARAKSQEQPMDYTV